MQEGQIVLSFIRVNKSWYTQPEVVGQDNWDKLYSQEQFGLFASRFSNGELDPIDGEFYVRFHQIGNELCPRLEAFQDAWHLLPFYTYLFDDMAKQKIVSGDDFEALLLKNGLFDVTKRDNPENKPRSRKKP